MSKNVKTVEEKVIEERVESVWKTLKNCKVKAISQPETIADIAENNNINPSDVFVRLTFEYEDKEYTASQRLRIIGKDNYKKLLDMKGKDEVIILDVSNTEFFRIHKEVSLDDLFKNSENKSKDLRNSVSTLFA